ncbi:MAG: sugar transferase [Clostridia bacterium]|nr:sugar transferase [Clostridia bacterium]
MRGTITQDVVTDTLVLNPDVELIEEKRIDSEFEATNITALEVYHRESKIQKYINLILKRIIDIIGAIVGIIFLIPLTLIVFLANIISGDFGPLFYSHKRIGKNGKHFKMYKFRSMCIDADVKLKELLENDEEARIEWEKNQKLNNDPRITKMGKILRKTSLDEFPQFINVLKGEMSLVGPRAVVDGEIEKFGIVKEKVLSVKPGITGYWAANGRSDTDYDERVVMESIYVNKFSIIEDIKILLKTVESVVKMKGAV